jgi:hypothetical protein
MRTWLTFAMLVLLGACQASRATRQDCEAILERIVDIELMERGYRDPMLQKIKQTAFRKKLGAELERCVGKRLEKKAIDCVRSASTIEVLTHDCFGD